MYTQSSSIHYEQDDEYIYEAPATSVHGLYAQFEKIKVTSIPSSSVE